MKRCGVGAFALGWLALMWLAACSSPPPNATITAATPTDVAKKAEAATVIIRSFDGRNRATGMGSGFLVSANGLLVTNAHVVRGAARLQVELSTKEVYDNVSYLTGDARRDLVVLMVAAERLPFLGLGDDQTLRVGDKVYAMGNPIGMNFTFTDGVVSAVDRQIGGVSWLQISTPISPGSSGGPILDSAGNAVGVATMTVTDGANLGLASPAHYVRPLLQMAGTGRPVPWRPGLLNDPPGGEPTARSGFPDDLPGPPAPPRATPAPAPTRGSAADELALEIAKNIAAQLALMREAASRLGFESIKADMRMLRSGASTTIPVRLVSGHTYMVNAACDMDCDALDMTLLGASGRPIDAVQTQLESTPTAMFDAQRSEDAIVRITMRGCSASPCGFGVDVLQK